MQAVMRGRSCRRQCRRSKKDMDINIIILVVLIIAVALLALVLIKLFSGKKDQGTKLISDSMSRISDQMDADRKTNAQYNSFLREDVGNNFRELMKENSTQKAEIMKLLKESINELQESNEKKLDKIQGVVDEKLDKTLNERLDTNFKQVGEQLGNLYKSLGEIKELSTGVQDLNKTLSNVKTRGTWGEVQLGRILEQTLTRSQYEENIATKHNSTDRVEYAIRIPGESGENVYLPIDAKFPSDIYNKIVDAGNASNAAELSAAVAELKTRILTEARTIRDKYIDPPYTTNYAIMFLPTEGLFAEVLRIDELTQQCQKIGVMVTGPTTITAVLNSLQAGFRNIQLSKKSVEVMKLLEAIKAQFTKMDEDVERTRKKLEDAASATEKLQNRTNIIKKRMRKIGEMDIEEADSVLEIENE